MPFLHFLNYCHSLNFRVFEFLFAWDLFRNCNTKRKKRNHRRNQHHSPQYAWHLKSWTFRTRELWRAFQMCMEDAISLFFCIGFFSKIKFSGLRTDVNTYFITEVRKVRWYVKRLTISKFSKLHWFLHFYKFPCYQEC